MLRCASSRAKSRACVEVAARSFCCTSRCSITGPSAWSSASSKCDGAAEGRVHSHHSATASDASRAATRKPRPIWRVRSEVIATAMLTRRAGRHQAFAGRARRALLGVAHGHHRRPDPHRSLAHCHARLQVTHASSSRLRGRARAHQRRARQAEPSGQRCGDEVRAFAPRGTVVFVVKGLAEKAAVGSARTAFVRRSFAATAAKRRAHRGARAWRWPADESRSARYLAPARARVIRRLR